MENGSAAKSSINLRIMLWNIKWFGHWDYKGEKLTMISQTIKNESPDIFLIQECMRYRCDQLLLLQKKLNMEMFQPSTGTGKFTTVENSSLTEFPVVFWNPTTVHMNTSPSVNDKELKQGYITTYQSYPHSGFYYSPYLFAFQCRKTSRRFFLGSIHLNHDNTVLRAHEFKFIFDMITKFSNE
jgi:hypothetical protein